MADRVDGGKRVVFHTGFMKTATTFLQTRLFPALPGTALYSYGGDGAFIRMMSEVRVAAPVFDHDGLIDTLRGWIAASAEPLQLFSWEGMVGHYLGNHRDFETITGFLHRAVPDARILLIVRRQSDLLESLYRQSLHTGHFSTPARFLNLADGSFGPFDPLRPANVDVRTLDFDRFIGRYEALFGAGNVFVLPYEALVRDRARFLARLGDCLGVDVGSPSDSTPANVGYASRTAIAARWLNRLFRTPGNPGGLLPYRPFGPAEGSRARRAANALFDPRTLLQGPVGRAIGGSKAIFPREWHDRIMAIHAESNAALDRRLGLGLAAFGYCPGAA